MERPVWGVVVGSGGQSVHGKPRSQRHQARGAGGPNPAAAETLAGGSFEVSSLEVSSEGKLAVDDRVAPSHRGGLAYGARLGGGAIVFFVFALGGIGQLAGGFLADRVRPAVVYTMTIAATIPCALFMARLSVPAGFAAAALLAVFMFAEQPLENTMIAEATPSNWRSTIYGLKFILAFGVASFGMYAAGIVWRYAGLARVFDMYAIGATLMAGLAAWFSVRQWRWSKKGE